MSVRIYVEGGGDQHDTLARCRIGFAKFFAKVVPEGKKPSVIPCGGRDQTFKEFCIGLSQHPNDTVVLLVDSENALLHAECWQHLQRRDNWFKPDGADEDSVYLMVLCMESWFLADKEAVAVFYGKNFYPGALPHSTDIESVSKVEIQRSLNHAARDTKKEGYHKTQHGFDILASLDPRKVAKGSEHAKRLIDFLEAQ